MTKESIKTIKPTTIAISSVILLQFGFTYLPFMHDVFQTQAISWQTWINMIIIALFVFLIIECEKIIIRKLSLKG